MPISDDEAMEDDAGVRVRMTASYLLETNAEMYFAAENVVTRALMVARGDVAQAQELLSVVGEFLEATSREFRLREPEPLLDIVADAPEQCPPG